MCFNRKQSLNKRLFALTFAILFAPAAFAAEGSAGGVAPGDSQGGVTDRAYVTAPPHWAFIVEREAGSFLDCGDGADMRTTDKDGRDLMPLSCGVTLTETMVIPAAAASARLIVHF